MIFFFVPRNEQRAHVRGDHRRWLLAAECRKVTASVDMGVTNDE